MIAGERERERERGSKSQQHQFEKHGKLKQVAKLLDSILHSNRHNSVRNGNNPFDALHHNVMTTQLKLDHI
jgi:hypothetical protein